MRTISGVRRKAIAVEVRDLATGCDFAALAHELTTEGIFVSTFYDLPVGAEVSLEIALGPGTVLVKGTVESVRAANSGAPGFVVLFDEISQAGRALISAHLWSRAPTTRSNPVAG
jgi:hypothetical protein